MASMEKEKLLVKGSNPLQSLRLSSRVVTMALVGSWYCSNIGVLLLNKYLLSNYDFRFPIFLTMCHMTACSLFSYVSIAWFKLVPMQPIRSRVQFTKILALSVIFCTSVVNGNISLRYLPVSFNQAIGATTPFFTAVFAYFMTVKRESWLTYLTLLPVVTGVVIASGGEPSFHMYGFIMCLLATAARALKSVLQGLLLSSEGEKLNSMNLLLYMAPIAVVLLLPATLLMEPNVLGITIALARQDVKIIYYLLFNSALAYFVNLTNFLVTKHTSPLTLQVEVKDCFKLPANLLNLLGCIYLTAATSCAVVYQQVLTLPSGANGSLQICDACCLVLGNAKGALAVVVSILLFRNPVSIIGMLGYTLTVIGVILYSESKRQRK